MAVNDLQIKSFDFAADVAKQLITLATAIITVMITFSKDILGTNSHYIAWLLSSWILFLLSIVFGIFTLMALTGVLAQSQKTQNIEDRKELENFNNSGMHIPADTRSAFPVISVHSPVSIQYRWQS